MAVRRPLAMLAAETICLATSYSGEQGRLLMQRLARVGRAGRRCLHCSAAVQSGAVSQADGRKFLIIDGSQILHRSHGYQATQNLGTKSIRLQTKDGIDSQVQNGFAWSIYNLLKDHEPSHVCVVFDSRSGPAKSELELRGWLSDKPRLLRIGDKSWRHAIFPDYKSGRAQHPAEIAAAKEWIDDFLRALGVPAEEMPNVEGDDLIATLALDAFEDNSDGGAAPAVIIASNDKDFYQLLRPGISIVKSNKQKDAKTTLVDEQNFSEMVDFDGLRPEQHLDYLALVGDSSDAIPGVEGVGPKKALALLQYYDSMHIALDIAAGPSVREAISEKAVKAAAAKWARIVPSKEGFDDSMLKMAQRGLKALHQSAQPLGADGSAAQGAPAAAGAGTPRERALLSWDLAELCRLQQPRKRGWLDDGYRLMHPDDAWVFRLLRELELNELEKALPRLWKHL